MTIKWDDDTTLNLGQGFGPRLSSVATFYEGIQSGPDAVLKNASPENNVMMISNFKRLSAEWQKLFVDSTTENTAAPTSTYRNNI
jgi:hypothetical protein